MNRITTISNLRNQLIFNSSKTTNNNSKNNKISIVKKLKLINYRTFSSTNSILARGESLIDYYKSLEVSKTATKKEIKESFYKLSKIYHPDAASSSNPASIEANTVKFHALSEAYAVLGEDVARRNYDRSLLGYHRPTYTSATTSSQSGFGGGAASAYSSDNNYRRERANYAWAHPSRRPGDNNGPSAADSARARTDPFRRDDFNNNGNGNGNGNSTTMDDHFHRFAKQQARANIRTMANKTKGSPYSSSSSGFSGFGAKAEEESRLVNDSGVKRSGQVFLVFGGCFMLAAMLSSSGKNNSQSSLESNRIRK